MNRTRALIGFSGFVGGNLLRITGFDSLYNSTNINEIQGKEFDIVVCAGLPAEKWRANKDPERDQSNIELLKGFLRTIKANRFILISTIDVYPLLIEKDETFDCSSLHNNPYGSNRLDFECFCRRCFNDCYVFRLPALFGKGLKKNVIFDLVHSNMLEKINPSSTFQYYDLNDLWNDISIAIENDIHLLNLFTEPIKTSFIVDHYFPDVLLGTDPYQEAHYDLRTVYGHFFGGTGGYIRSKEDIMEKLGVFLKGDK